MAPTPTQVAIRNRVEGLIALASPLLDLLLAAGDRVSRAVGTEDEYYPIRASGEGFELPGAAREEPDEVPGDESPAGSSAA